MLIDSLVVHDLVFQVGYFLPGLVPLEGNLVVVHAQSLVLGVYLFQLRLQSGDVDLQFLILLFYVLIILPTEVEFFLEQLDLSI